MPVVFPIGFFKTSSTSGWAGPATNLVHRWAFDSVTSGTDQVGSLNGTATGAGVTNTTGPSGGSNLGKAVNGTDYYQFASTLVPALAGAHTVAMWVKVTDPTAASGIGSPQTIFASRVDATHTVRVLISGGTPGGFHVDIYNGTEVHAGMDITQQFFANTWAHIAWVWNGTTITALYKNASSLSIDDTTAVGAYGQPNSNNIASRDNDSNGALTGAIAQCVVYDAALSAGNITSIYNAF